MVKGKGKEKENETDWSINFTLSLPLRVMQLNTSYLYQVQLVLRTELEARIELKGVKEWEKREKDFSQNARHKLCLNDSVCVIKRLIFAPVKLSFNVCELDSSSSSSASASSEFFASAFPHLLFRFIFKFLLLLSHSLFCIICRSFNVYTQKNSSLSLALTLSLSLFLILLLLLVNYTIYLALGNGGFLYDPCVTHCTVIVEEGRISFLPWVNLFSVEVGKKEEKRGEKIDAF